MEIITSRQNRLIAHFRQLGRSGEYRQKCGEFLCDGEKLFAEALENGAEVTAAVWVEAPENAPVDKSFLVSKELLEYASPLKHSPGPLFSVRMPQGGRGAPIRRAVVLEGVQDPGNVGTVIRTADALGIDAVILLPGCADLYNPKTVRATMGAIFRQRVIERDLDGLMSLLEESGLILCGAALTPEAQDIRELGVSNMAVAIGSEGQGLSAALLARCRKKVVIPMSGKSESLNAAVAAAIIMWELTR